MERLLSFFLPGSAGADFAVERLRSLERFSAATARVRDNLHRRIPISELAALAGMHPTYFANEFSRAFGIPPRRYIMVKRVELAQRLLWTGDDPLKAVAAVCGLEEPAYFSRVFRKIAGVSPGAYRAMGRRLSARS